MKVGVLASGYGSNLLALINKSKQEDASFEIVHVIANFKSANALNIAQKFNITHSFISHKDFNTRETFDLEVKNDLIKHNCELIVLAGFLRVITPVLLDAFKNKIINIHPSLLPSFKGLDAPQQALDAGVKITGCTVHIVDSGVDTGKILAQHAVNILDNDTEEILSYRIQKTEWQLLPHVVQNLGLSMG